MRKVLIGKSRTSDIRPDDEYVSDLHCYVTQEDSDINRATVMDLGSTNGTYVLYPGDISPVRVAPRLTIFPGCTLIVGRTRITWRKQ